ncbi:VOC family protein [Marinoscillum sp.]|uniref:VOC family protein n=1 Tax=Marinoscillum sp. TaxID=2024838 RepID=UPI003BAD20B5
MQQLVQLALVVADYDEAIAFYTQTLRFELIEDTKMSETKRWVVVAPPGNTGCRLLLAKAVGDEQLSRVGKQTGGRVFLFIHTDDFEGDYENLKAKGVKIVRGPVDEPYGRVLVFADLYGNLIDLIQPA